MKNRTRLNLNLLFAFLILVLILFFFFQKSGYKPMERTVRFVTAPFANFFAGAGFWFNEKFEFFGEIGELKEQNELLEEENMKLKAKVARCEEIKTENKILREEIELAPREEFELVSSLVIGRDFLRDKEIVYISKGEKSGLEKDMPVVVGEGVLVGRISKTHSNSSEIELVLSRDNKINAEIVENQAKGIVHGEYGTSAVMDMIPQSAEVEKDQMVVTSGLGEFFPRGLLIGYTKEPFLMADKLFQKASLILPKQLDSLRVVWVIRNHKKKVIKD